MNAPSARSLSRLLKTAYAAPAFALAVVGIPVYIYIPKFYTDTVGINVTVVGILLMAVRIFDAVTDPVVGLLSDKTRSRYGRRRPFIAFGAILLVISMFGLFNPPSLSPDAAVYWFAFWLFALFLFWTLVVVPYESLGLELTFDYTERISLFGLRDGFLIAGTLFAAALPALLSNVMPPPSGAVGQAALEQTKFFYSSIIYGVIILIGTALCIRIIRERKTIDTQPQAETANASFSVLKNRHFVVLLIAYTISAFGSNLPAALILYYVEYVLASGKADVFLALYFLSGIVFLPAWMRIAERLGKKNAWILSMLVNTLAFSGVFFLGRGDEWIYGILVLISGTGFGAGLALPSAIQADVVDYDEMISGKRREGRYIGIWSIAKKLTAALSVGVAFVALGSVGYRAAEAQSESVIFMLRFLYALVPSVCSILAILVITRFQLDREAHWLVREKIRRRSLKVAHSG